MQFEHVVIDAQTPGEQNDVCLIADVNGDGYNDIIIGGKRNPGNIIWYEYPTWKRHTIGTAILEAGGTTMEIAKSGLPDMVAGNPFDKINPPPGNTGKEMYWFENSGDPDKEWTKHILCDDLLKYHDQAAGDVDNDGEPELIFASQGSKVLGYYDLPPNPRETPWPKQYRHIICEDIVAEGLVVADLDGDGQNELVAGSSWFKWNGSTWDRHDFGLDFIYPRVAVADLNGDGKPEIVLSEGEKPSARMAIFSGPEFKEVKMLAEDLFHAHSLAVGDMNGNGLPDIFVGEMGLGRNTEPRIMVYENKGGGEFEQVVIDKGKPTHCAQIGDIGKSGRLSIVGKPYHPERCVDLWLNKG